MKHLNRLTAAAACLAALASSAFADTVSKQFSVSATFTPACLTNNSSPTTLDFGSYTAFGSAATSAPTTSISFKCSRGMTLTSAVFDPGTDASTGTASTTPTGAGVVAGLRYTLTTAAAVKTTTGTAATTSAAGTADVYTYVITGAMDGGQAGCSTCASTQIRTLTMTY